MDEMTAPPNMPADPKMAAPPEDSPFTRAIALLPEPKDGKYNPKIVKAVAEQLLDTWDAVSEYVPLPPPPPLEALIPAGYTGEGKIPEMLAGAFTLLLTAIAETAGADGERYLVDVEALVDDMAVRKVEAQLKLLAKDKKVRKAVEAVMKSEEGSESDDMGEPSDMDTDDMGEPKMMGPPPIPKGMSGAL
jgi:hypothetical protein